MLLGRVLRKSTMRFSRDFKGNKSYLLTVKFLVASTFFSRSCSIYFVTLMKEHKINTSRIPVEMHSFSIAKIREVVSFAQTDGKIKL